MKKKELLEIMDNELLEKLYGFCYARTGDSYEAQDLCSDISVALVKAANAAGEIKDAYPFVWKVARNVYADFCRKRKRDADLFYEGDAQEVLPYITKEEAEDDSGELLDAVYRQIAFLTKAYREVMILFYLDGLSTAEIAKQQRTSEAAVRQRLFSARKKVRSEVGQMNTTCKKPVTFHKMEYVIWGTGNPGWGDPRSVCQRQFSKHILWLCHKKPKSAGEIAKELNVPTLYVDEELEILAAGENGEYGLLRKLENGKYALNFILLDADAAKKAQSLYLGQLPAICDHISDFIGQHKEEYLAFPYLNKKVSLNLILWQQIFTMAGAFSENVEKILEEKYFAGIKTDRPFTVYGYVDDGKNYGAGWDGVDAEHVCGYSKIHLDNIYITRIRKHFHCGLNVAADPQIQLALRAIDGLSISSLTELEKEHVAKCMECGYLYREGGMLYTKILVSDMKDMDRLYAISSRLRDGFLQAEAEVVAGKLADMIHKVLPEYLFAEWKYFNMLADLPIFDSLVENFIERGILIPPKDGIGAEGCWMSVAK